MAYKSLMVHLELGRRNEAVLGVAGDLAERFGACVLGIAAAQPIVLGFGSDCYVPPALVNEDRNDTEQLLRTAEAEFRSALKARATSLEWRAASRLAPLHEYIANEARSADLVISCVPSDVATATARRVDAGAMVMELGRPLLTVPLGAMGLKLEQVLVAWKDASETRRAIADALPLLLQAGAVCLVAIDAEAETAQRQLDDVARWLARHGVKATALVSHPHGDDGAALNAHAHRLGSDLIVAGAYGHSRAREFLLGGVTRSLLHRPQLCSLLSH
jgi:nucleotide-binding universal stress UspA family protein